jgi:hypothetical protein
MHLSHDRRIPWDVDVLDAGVRDRPDGYEEAWAVFMVEEADWERFRSLCDELGAPGGMSFSMSTPLRTNRDATSVGLSFSADAHHFGRADLIVLADEVATESSVIWEPNHYYQFGADPLPMVVLEYSLSLIASLPPDLLGAYLYDVICRFFRIRRTKDGPATIFEFHVRNEEDVQEFKAYLQTNSSEVAKYAMDTFKDVLNGSGAYEFEVERREWKRLQS